MHEITEKTSEKKSSTSTTLPKFMGSKRKSEAPPKSTAKLVPEYDNFKSMKTIDEIEIVGSLAQLKIENVDASDDNTSELMVTKYPDSLKQLDEQIDIDNQFTLRPPQQPAEAEDDISQLSETYRTNH